MKRKPRDLALDCGGNWKHESLVVSQSVLATDWGLFLELAIFGIRKA